MSEPAVTELDHKTALHRSLGEARKAMLWKLDGLGEYDVRRPMTATGTNLLGLVKHLASIELGYFGEVFGRPSAEPTPWHDVETDPNADMWATGDESREHIVDLYHRAWEHADATIGALALDARGRVPWRRGDRREVTLHRVLVEVLADTHRHAGQADIVRELIDGAAGLTQGNDNLPSTDAAWWARHRDRLDQVARDAAQNR